MDPADFVMTFSRVPRYLQDTNRPCTVSSSADLLQCRYEDQQVSSLVAMRPLQTDKGTAWVAMSIPICATEQIRLRAVLAANDQLPFGALADWQGMLLLRQTLPLESLTFVQFEIALRALVHTAAELASTAAVAASDPDVEARYAYLFR